MFHYPPKEESKKAAPRKKEKKLAPSKTASKVKSPTCKRPRNNEENEMTKRLRSRNKHKADDLSSHESDEPDDSN